MPLHAVFFYLTLILLPTQLGYHFWPDWALVIGRRVDYLAPTIYLTDVLVFATILSWIISILNKRHPHIFSFFCLAGRQEFSIFKKKSKSQFSISKLVQLVGLVVLVGLNIFFAVSPIVAIFKWLKVLEFIVFGLYIIKTKPSFSRAIWCLSCAVLYSSLIAIAQFFLQHSVGGFLWFLGERTFDISTPGIARISLQPIVFSHQTAEVLRSYATFPHPNVLGGFLAVLVPLIIFQFTNQTNPTNKISKFTKIFFLVTIALGIIAFLLTFSRSAWAAGAIGICSLLIYNLCHSGHRAGIIKMPRSLVRHDKIGVIIILIIFVGCVGFFLLPYFQTLTADSESVFVRNELANTAINIWKSSPMIGVGLGNYLVELPKYYPHRDIFFLQPVHNIYLLILSETGIIGLLFFLSYVLKIFLLKTRERSIENWHLKIGVLILLLLGAVDHYSLTLQQGQLLLTALISMNFYNNNGSVREA